MAHAEAVPAVGRPPLAGAAVEGFASKAREGEYELVDPQSGQAIKARFWYARCWGQAGCVVREPSPCGLCCDAVVRGSGAACAGLLARGSGRNARGAAAMRTPLRAWPC